MALSMLELCCIVTIGCVSSSGCSSQSNSTDSEINNELSRDTSSLALDSDSDTDMDGIRDDVNLYIDSNFIQSSTEWDAAVQYAKSINSYGLSKTSAEADIRAVDLQKSIECIYLYLPENSTGTAAGNMISSLEGETFNNKSRAETWYGTDALLTKSTYTAINPDQNNCF